MKSPLISVLVVSLLSVGLMGCNLQAKTEPEAQTPTPAPVATVPAPDSEANADESETSEAEDQQTGVRYEDYTAAKFAALKGKQPVAISFHADWCPNCRALEKDIKANLSQLPDDAVILVADYDTEIALKKEFGITVQTTVVFFDRSGKQTEAVYKPSIEKLKELLSV